MEELASFLTSLNFATPLFFFIGGVFVLLLIFFPWTRKRTGVGVDLRYWKPRVTFKTRRFLLLSIPVVIVSVLMAGVLSDPKEVTRPTEVIYGKPVMAMVDISGSMNAAAGGQTQLSDREMVIATFNDLIARRANISFGLTIYSTDSYVARYFTYKNELFKDTLDNEIEINRLAQGTHTAEALERVRSFFAHTIEGSDKAVVLISDFNMDPTSMSDMIEEMQEDLLAGIKIYLISTGEETQDTLAIPQMTGLKIISITDKQGIDQMYQELSAIKNSPLREEQVVLKKTIIPLLILPVLVLIMFSLILGETRFRKIP